MRRDPRGQGRQRKGCRAKSRRAQHQRACNGPERETHTQQNQTACHQVANNATGDPGDLNDAVVLAESGVREGADTGGQNRVQTISDDTATDACPIAGPGQRLLGQHGSGGNVAHRLGDRHEEDGQHQNIKGDIETDRER